MSRPAKPAKPAAPTRDRREEHTHPRLRASRHGARWQPTAAQAALFNSLCYRRLEPRDAPDEQEQARLQEQRDDYSRD